MKNNQFNSSESSDQMKTALRNKEYLSLIDESIDQLESGRGQQHELIEDK